MTWIKHVILDLVMLAVVAVWALVGIGWMWWVIAIYTPLLIVLKVAAFSMGVSTAVKAKGGDQAPDWFFHVVYALSVVLMLVAGNMIFAAGWALIWILSAAGQARSRTLARSRTSARGRTSG